MAFVWLTVVFNYYLLKFMINTFEQVYTTGLLSSLTGLAAYWHGGILYKRLGLKMSITVSMVISFSATVVIILIGLHFQSHWTFPIMVVFAEYGIAASFTIIYVSHPTIFPVLFATTALGFVNFGSRSLSTLAPLLAVVDQPLPMMVFGGLCAASGVLVWRVELNKEV